MRVRQSQIELLSLLRERIQFLEAAAQAYDKGFEGEAKRLAVVLRVLLHDSRSSYSLLRSLGAKSNLRFWDVAGPPDNGIDFVGLGMAVSTSGVRYSPKFAAPNRRILFEGWWAAFVLIHRVNEIELSRGKSILSLAETEIDAHVDPELDALYLGLSKADTFGWEVTRNGNTSVVENNPLLPIVRQIAHEVLGTLREQMSDVMPN